MFEDNQGCSQISQMENIKSQMKHVDMNHFHAGNMQKKLKLKMK